MTRRHHLKLVSDETSSGVLLIGPAGLQPELPLVGHGRGIAVMATDCLSGRAFRQQLDMLQPKIVLDVRVLQRLDFIGYSRWSALDDLRRVGARYVRASHAEVKDPGHLSLLALLERAGLTKSSMCAETVLMLVDDERDMEPTMRMIAGCLEAAGWNNTSVFTTDAVP